MKYRKNQDRRFRPTCRKQCGWTLIELSVAMTLVSLVVGSVGSVGFDSQLFFSDEMQQYVIGDTERRVMNRIEEELRRANAPTINPIVLVNANAIEFQQVTGFIDGVLQLGPPVTIALDLPENLPQVVMVDADPNAVPISVEDAVNAGSQFDPNRNFDVAGNLELGKIEVFKVVTVSGSPQDIERGKVVLTVEGQNAIVLTENVVGLRFNSLQNGIAVSLDVARIDSRGFMVKKTFTRVINFRN